MIEVVLIDFNDSFSLNIASEIHKFIVDGSKVQIINYKDAKKKVETIFNRAKNEKTYRAVVIWGPGPGHPDEYKSCFDLSKKLLDTPNIFTMGICLGHQLIWRAKGAEVRRSKKPMHGISVEFKIPSWNECFPKKYYGKKVKVQRYNSLVVKQDSINFDPKICNIEGQNQELVISSGYNFITYQFHPESVGTSFSKIFFYPVKKFLYN